MAPCKHYLDQGKEPPEYDPLNRLASGNGVTTVAELCYYWMQAKEVLRDAGELEARTLEEYKSTCKLLLSIVGNTLPASMCGPQKFEQVRRELAKRLSSPSVSISMDSRRELRRFEAYSLPAMKVG